MADDTGKVKCPVCSRYWRKSNINVHVNSCLNSLDNETDDKGNKRTNDINDHETTQPEKRLKSDCMKLDDDQDNVKLNVHANATQTKQDDAANSTAWKCLIKSGLRSKEKNHTSNVTSLEKASEIQISPRAQPSSCCKLSSGGTGTTSATSINATKPKGFTPNSQLSVDQSPISKITKGKYTFFSTRQSTSRASSQLQFGVSQSSRVQDSAVLPLKVPIDQTTNGSSQVLKKQDVNVPLAERMRPLSLKDFVGQEQILGHNKLLRSLMESHRLPSMILWGPPGCGKTTLAKIISQRCKESHNTRFTMLSATTAGVADVKEVTKIAKNEVKMFKRQTILFVDEIHRFNKLQQDSFLPHIEDGTIILIGATTENPSFHINNALLSRCKCITLEKLSVESLLRILLRAMKEVGVSVVKDGKTIEDTQTDQQRMFIEEASLEMLAGLCDGDARIALNGLQSSVECKQAYCSTKNDNQPVMITKDDVKEALQKSHILYDRAGEEHYNCASALQKSIRGSDENAAIYWLARMLEGGEDPLFIARRLVVTASEDIGMADPQALLLAMSTHQACQVIGKPECRINLAHCTTYLSRAPKSTESFRALERALSNIRHYEGPLPSVPLHLRNAPTKLTKELGYGKGYKYNPAFEGKVEQHYLPESLISVNFFEK